MVTLRDMLGVSRGTVEHVGDLSDARRPMAVCQTAGNQSRPSSRRRRNIEAMRAALEIASVIFIDESGEGPDGRVRRSDSNPPAHDRGCRFETGNG